MPANDDWLSILTLDDYPDVQSAGNILIRLSKSQYGINVNSFGTVKGDGVINDADALQAIIDAFPGRIIYAQRTATSSDDAISYYLESTLRLDHPGTILCGDGGGYQGGTIMKWKELVPGISVTGSGCTIRDLALFGSEKYDGIFHDQGVIPAERYTGLTEETGASAADGIRIGTPYVRLSNLVIQYWGRDGINCSAHDQGLDSGFGAEDCQFDRVFLANNRGCGLRIEGGDSNCIQVNSAVLFVNQLWGIDASSFLAGTFISPQATNNGLDTSARHFTSNNETTVTLNRTSNTVTAVVTDPIVIEIGEAIWIKSADDSSFIGRWRIATVSSDHLTFTWQQVDSNASTTGVCRATWIPPDNNFISAIRNNNIVTLTLSAPYLTTGVRTSTTGKNLRIGQGITLQNCSNKTFNGTYIILSVNDNVITFTQTGSNITITSGIARAAIPYDTYQLTWPEWAESIPTAAPQKILGGSYRAPFRTSRQAWINPYAEGAQRLRLSSGNVVIAPSWSEPNESEDIGSPLIIYGTSPGTNTAGMSHPPSFVWNEDTPASSINLCGRTSAQKYYSYFGFGSDVYWVAVIGNDEWTLLNGNPALNEDYTYLRFLISVGYAYLNSRYGGMVRINVDADTGTGGLLIGDGSGGSSLTSIIGGIIKCDLLETSVTSTGSRLTATRVGQQGYDSTLHIPIWWDGTHWRDAAGNTV